MRTFKIAVVLVICLVLCSAFLNIKTNYQKATETFLAGIIKGEVEQTYDEFLAGTELVNQVDAIQNQKQQVSRFFDTYGKLLSYEYIKTQQYGKSVIRLVYILKCEKTPLVWEFYFYKADSDWMLLSLKFRDNYDLLADK